MRYDKSERKSLLPEYIERMMRFGLLDWQNALDQMYLLVSLQAHVVFKRAGQRKLIKHQYARDDPAFVLLFAFFMMVCGIAYGLAFVHLFSIWNLVKFVFWLVGFDYIATGLFFATFTYFLVNQYMKKRSGSLQEKVEWLFCFDVHVNAFFTVFIYVYVGQFFLLPLLIRENFWCMLLGNSLYCFAFCNYFYITFRGFVTQRQLEKSLIVLAPIVPIVLLYLISLLSKFHVVNFVLFKLYFSR